MGEHAHKKLRRFAKAPGRAPPRPSLYELEAEAMKALAHPKRLLILDLLSDGRERAVGELLAETSMSQSNLSQNLAVMRAAGLLVARRDGSLVYYRVVDARVVRAVGLLRGMLEKQIGDQQFLVERASHKRQQRVRRATLGAFFLLAGLAAMAALHPLAVGGDLAAVGRHLEVMASSPSMMALFSNCANVAMEPPAQLSHAPMGLAVA